MGQCKSCNANGDAKVSATTRISASFSAEWEPTKSEWNKLYSAENARNKFHADGSIPAGSSDSMYELRFFMDDGELLTNLLTFASQLGEGYSKVVVCWVDIETYKSLGTDDSDLQRWTALYLCEKYIDKRFNPLPEDDFSINKDPIDECFEVADEDLNVALPIGLFDELQMKCLLCIFNKVWSPFICSPVFEKILTNMKTYRNVDPDDFLYFEQIGEGSFGLVVRALKKSTGTYYAIKVITKSSLLLANQSDPHRVTLERRVMTKCNHPFIIGLDYAFQTIDLVMMAMELGRCGTLHDAMCQCLNGVMDPDRVRFYTAEIVLGLSHMHKMGLVYRDVKPGNVLLMPNGHIKLLDLGCVVDPHEQIATYTHTDTYDQVNSSSNEQRDFSGMSSSEWDSDATPQGTDRPEALSSRQSSAGSSGYLSVRARSVVGTLGFMAPEVLGMWDRNFKGYDKGYTKSADYYSLGMTMIVLLKGQNPFSSDNFHHFLRFLHDEPPMVYKHCLDNLKASLDGPTYEIISQFISLEAMSRLGSGRNGLKKIQAQPYFSGLNWDMLGRRSIAPPFVPEEVLDQQSLEYSSFSECIADVMDGTKNRDVSAEDNRFFDTWDYVAPKTVKLEIGMLSGRLN